MNAAILLFFIFLIGIGIIFIFQNIRSKIFRLLSWKITAFAAGLYLGILILLYPALYLLPGNHFIKSADNHDKTVTATQNLLNTFYNEQSFLKEKEIVNVPGVYKNSSRSFKSASHQLSLDIQRGPVTPHIFVEKKDIADGTIDVSTYVTAHYIGNVDFSKQISPPTILLQNDCLHLISPSYQTFEYKQFNSDFTLNQFTTHSSNNVSSTKTTYGGHIVYILVPNNVEIIAGKDQNLVLGFDSP